MWPLVQIAITIGNSIPILHIFIFWQVAGWQCSMKRPPIIIMQNIPPLIIDRSSPGGGSREGGGVFHKNSNIYRPHPNTAPDQGTMKRYVPSRETPRRWRTHMPKWSTIGRWGLFCCILKRTLRQRDSKTSPKTILYITCRTSLTRAAPNKDG